MVKIKCIIDLLEERRVKQRWIIDTPQATG